MPVIIRKIKNKRIISFDSLNKIIPRIAVPTAPMPVQTAYAVPTGRDLTEKERSPILVIIAEIVKTDGQSLVKPLEYFTPIAHATSKRPAINRIIQAIIIFL
jgi:hypothetical protein